MLRLLGYIVDTDISPDMPLLLYGILKVLYISWSKVFIMAMLYHCSSLNVLCTAATTYALLSRLEVFFASTAAFKFASLKPVSSSRVVAPMIQEGKCLCLTLSLCGFVRLPAL